MRTRQLHETLHSVVEDASPAHTRHQPLVAAPALSNTEVNFSELTKDLEFQGMGSVDD